MILFLPYYVAALAMLYFELRGTPPRAVPTPRLPATAWIGGLVLSYAIQLALVRYASLATTAAEPWRAALPIGVAAHDVAGSTLVCAAMLALALAQSYALLALYRRPASRTMAIAGSVVLCALSLAAPAFISPDPYAYVGDAMLGRASYAPPNRAFGGDFSAIDRFFAPPMLPSPYGPLWTVVAQIITSPLPILLGKLLALRALGLACFVALIAALRAAGAPARLLAVVALNPGILQQYVASAHNDAFGIVALVVAGALASRSAWLAAALLIAGGLVKLPFVVLGLPVLAVVRSRTSRYAAAAAAVLATVAISYWGAGVAYFRGLEVHVPAPGPVYVVNGIVAALAFAALGVALIGGPRLRAAIWLIPMASSYVASWYAIYGLPYALARRRMLAYLLIAFPFATVLIDAKFIQWWTYTIVLPLVVVFSFAWPRGLKRTSA